MMSKLFCYICFECSKNLRDVLGDSKDGAEIVQKLKQCVSEVNWLANQHLLICDKCIRKLNRVYEFRRQCIQSSDALKPYLAEIQKAEEKRANESPVLNYLNLLKNDNNISPTSPPPLVPTANVQSVLKSAAVPPTVPEQKVFPAITKIILTNPQTNTFQNVFLNLLPQKQINGNCSKPSPVGPAPIIVPQVLLANDNLPKSSSASTAPPTCGVEAVILNSNSTEELSCEVDPLDISMETESKPMQMGNNLRPILPKFNDTYDYTNEEKMEFFNSGHFLVQDDRKRFFCEKCLVQFDSVKTLNLHIQNVHSSKFPYRCDMCDLDFASKETYKSHMKKLHTESSDVLNNCITLNDFANNDPKVNDLLVPMEVIDYKDDALAQQQPEIRCNMCDRTFQSYPGLLRHKTQRHKNGANSGRAVKKRYFVKGMKNAECNICNRKFSTVAYMHLHRKLHEKWEKLGNRTAYKSRRSTDEEAHDNVEEGDDDESFDESKTAR